VRALFWWMMVTVIDSDGQDETVGAGRDDVCTGWPREGITGTRA